MRWTAVFLFLLPRNLLILTLIGYRKLISPLYGDVCRYYPSCSSYALMAVGRQGVVFGSARTLWRLVRCNPWSPGGVDEVSGLKNNRYSISSLGFVSPIGSRTGSPFFDFFASPATAHSHRKG